MPPFDGPYLAPVAVPTAPVFDFDTASPDKRLIELARLLENEQEWRDTLRWDFHEVCLPSAECGTSGCALGLAHLVWPQFMDGRTVGIFGEEAFRRAYHIFDITPGEARDLFGVEMAVRHEGYENVTPDIVATAIRQFVANRQEG